MRQPHEARLSHRLLWAKAGSGRSVGLCRIVNGRTSITAEMALKLGAALGTTAEFWLNAQKAVDLFSARKPMRALPKRIKKAG